MPDSDKSDRKVIVSLDLGLDDVIEWTDRMFDVDKHRFIIGLNSAIGGAISTLCYQSLANVISRVCLPALSGVTASKLWENLISKPLEKSAIDCPVCVSTRGMIIALSTGTLIPAAIGTLLITRHRFSNGVGPRYLLKQLITPYFYTDNIAKRPLLAGTILTQVCLGFIMADREFEYMLRKGFASGEIMKGRKFRKVDDQANQLIQNDADGIEDAESSNFTE